MICMALGVKSKMHMWPQEATSLFQDLTKKVEGLTKTIDKASNRATKSSAELQRKLVFWTKVMAAAIIAQVVTIILTSML